MFHSVFENAHKGRYYKVTFYSREDGFTADLAIIGLPLITADNLWADREEARVSMIDLACNTIDQNP